jgi:hypothetical protein
MIPQSFKIEKIKESVTETKPYKRELNASGKMGSFISLNTILSSGLYNASFSYILSPYTTANLSIRGSMGTPP